MDFVLKLWHSEGVIPRALRSGIYAMLGYLGAGIVANADTATNAWDWVVANIDRAGGVGIAAFIVASGVTKVRLNSTKAAE